MLALPIPFTSTSLELMPRWGSPPTFVTLVPWLALAIVPVGLILWLYRYELKLVSRGVAHSLLTLRLLVIVLLTCLVTLQPRLLPAFQEKKAERVLVLVDRTGSMDALDPQRPPVDKLRLARALKLNQNLAADLLVDDWIAQYQKEGVIRWVADDEYPEDPEKKKRLETERRQQHDQLCDRIDKLSRTETSKFLLADDGGQLLRKLGKRFPSVEVSGFAEEIWEPPPGRIKELFNWPGKAEDRPKEKEPEKSPASSRAFTDLNLPLSHALDRVVQDKGAVRGVVLLSDGRQNRGELPLLLAQKLGINKAPIYPIAFGTRQSRQTLAVVSVEAPPVVLKDPDDSQTINAVVKANMRVRGIPAQAVVVELKMGDKILGRQRIAHDGVDRDYSREFPLSLDKEGPQKLLVEIQPIAQEGKTPLADKTGLRRPVTINVVKEQAEVLMIDGEARWEFHYVSVALSRDPLVKEVRSVVFDQPRLNRIPEPELQKQNWPAKTLPAEPDAMADYDCIILGDVPPEKLPLADRQRLLRFVEDCGGTLVIVAGKRSMPLLYPRMNVDSPETTDPIAKLLPIVAPHVVQSRNGFPVTLTDEGKGNPLLQLEDKNPDEADKGQKQRKSIWEELLPHYWAVVGQKKSAATTLAFYPGEADDPIQAQPKTRAERESQSLIAWHTVGKGRVLYVGLDSTLRWRFKVGDKNHHRFWGQLLRWATADKLLPGVAGPVRFGTKRINYEVGEEIEVQARLAKELDLLPRRPPAGKPYQARILRLLPDGKEEKAMVVELSVREGQPRVLETHVRDLPAGKYRIEELDLPPLADKMRGTADPSAPRPSRAQFSVVEPTNEEMLDVSTDWDLLKSLADKSTSARVYTPEDADKLIDELVKKDERAIDRKPRPLWEWWPVLVVILGLLTVEWVTRKWAGLP